jgi:hypothetical protein
MISSKEARNAVEYIQVTSDLINELQQKNAALEAGSRELQKQAKLQKQASASKPALDRTAVELTVDNMVKAGFFKQAEKANAVEHILQEPASLLSCLNKLATDSMNRVPKLGKGVTDKQASAPAERESDRQFESFTRNLYSKVAHS